MGLKLKFSHHYPKVHSQTKGRLIRVTLKNRKELSPELEEYDTCWADPDGEFGSYMLPNGFVLILYFVGDKGIPFCTIRRAFARKQDYYESKIGEIFEICVGGEKKKEVDKKQTQLPLGGT